MPKSPLSSADPEFLSTLESWFKCQNEILMMTRLSRAAGSRDFEFFSSFQTCADRIRQMPPACSIIAFRRPQLMLRGVVDDSFTARCLGHIPDGSEYLLIETVPSVYGQTSWFRHCSGESNAEMRADLERFRGVPAAVGLYPPWLNDTEDVISAIVPDRDGIARSGIY